MGNVVKAYFWLEPSDLKKIEILSKILNENKSAVVRKAIRRFYAEIMVERGVAFEDLYKLS